MAGGVRAARGPTLEATPSLSYAELYARARAKVPDKVRLRAGRITRRSPLVAAVLCVATLGIYGIYWLYRTTAELRETTSHREMRPVRDVALTALSLGLYGIVAVHRQSRMVHAVSRYFERSHRDRSWEVLVYALGAPLSLGLLGAAAVHVVQRQMNELADLADARERDRARRAARVVTPPARRFPAPASSARLEAAPSSGELPDSLPLEATARAPVSSSSLVEPATSSGDVADPASSEPALPRDRARDH